MAITKRVILAAGHGLGDPGAVAQGTTEYIEAIQITDKVAYYLRENGGIEVHVVPHTLGLVDSINWVNARWHNINDGIAIEIHKNAGGGTGNEVWCPSYSDATARDYSNRIAAFMAAETGLRNRGVKEAQTNRFGKLGWTDDTNTYACLVEAGFIDVDPVHDDMDSRMARGIANGIIDYFGVKKVEPPKPAPSPAPKITYAKIDKKSIQLTRNANLWNFNFTDWSKATPVKGYSSGDIVKDIVAIATNQLGAKYYVSEYSYKNNKTNGFNINDARDYVEPKPAEPTPKPVEPETPPTLPVNPPNLDEKSTEDEKTGTNPSDDTKSILTQVLTAFKKLWHIILDIWNAQK